MKITGPGAVAAMVGLILHGAAATAVAGPVTAPLAMSIPKQSLRDALNELARQTGLQVIYTAEDVTARITAPRLEGRYSPKDALSTLLMGSGLTYEFLTPRTVAIIQAEVASPGGSPPAADAGGDPLRLPNEDASQRLVLAQAAAAPDAEVQSQEVVVTSKVFKENDAFGASKMAIPLKDTPQTVMIVTQDLIEASGLHTFNDFYKLDASGGTAHAVDQFPRNYYRGFLQAGNNAIRVDGFRMPGNINLDFATFDRFEVIKGPTSTLYGQSSIGGTLNAVSKLPRDRFGGQLSLEGGQFNHYRLDGDVTGPLGGGDAWSYRLIGAYSDGDSFIDFLDEGVRLFSASIAYKPSESTHFTLHATLQKNDAGEHFPAGIQLAGTGTGTPAERALSEGLKFADVPRSRLYGMPWNHETSEARMIHAQAEHTFENEWQLRAHLQHNHVKFKLNEVYINSPIDEHGFTYSAYAYGFENVDDLYGGEVNLFGKVQLFGREHTLFFGADYSQIDTVRRGGFQSAWFGLENSLFNVFDPDYDAVPYLGFDNLAYLSGRDDESELYGATVQLILNPADRLKVLLGGRYSVDTLLQRRRFGSQAPGDGLEDHDFATTQDRKFTNFTLQTGVTYEVTEALNLYASYGQTFEPKTALVFVGPGLPGNGIDPEEGTNYEIGAKADWSRDLSFSMAVFQMERTNISQSDPTHPGFSLPLGTQRSRGVELGAQGRLAPPLNIFASIAYLDAEFSEGEFKGLQPANALRFGASIFGSYEILAGSMKGLGFGLGTVYKSGRKTFDTSWTRAAGAPVTFDFGSFTEVDARIFYGRERWSFTLAATNLFNEKYWSPTFNFLSFATHVNPPRIVQASVRYKF